MLLTTAPSQLCNLPVSFWLQGLFTSCSMCLRFACPHSFHILVLCILQVSAQISHPTEAFLDGPVLIMSPFMTLTTLRSHFTCLFSYPLPINCFYCLKQLLWNPAYSHHYEFETNSKHLVIFSYSVTHISHSVTELLLCARHSKGTGVTGWRKHTKSLLAWIREETDINKRKPCQRYWEQLRKIHLWKEMLGERRRDAVLHGEAPRPLWWGDI